MAILTPALVRLRSDFNALAPGRDKASDGWIGNAAHRGSVSDHNPDESGNPDVRDADRVDEVHAIDVDKDLRHPSITMQNCVRKILATPADRARLRYIIWNRTIWSASWGWTARAYTGSNPHTAHAHFSGSYATAAESNTAPWGIEELIDVTPEELLRFDPNDPGRGIANPYADKAKNPTIAMKTALSNIGRDALATSAKADRVLAAVERHRLELVALRGVVADLAEVIRSGGGSADTAAILRGVDERLAAARTDLRDAVADLGEGGAVQVRGPQG